MVEVRLFVRRDFFRSAQHVRIAREKERSSQSPVLIAVAAAWCTRQNRWRSKFPLVLITVRGCGFAAKVRAAGGVDHGDLYVVVHVEEHDFFKHDGETIYARLPVSMVNAALGCTLEVPTVHGKSKLSVPAGSQSGAILLSNMKVYRVCAVMGGAIWLLNCRCRLPPICAKSKKVFLKILMPFCEVHGQNKGHQNLSILSSALRTDWWESAPAVQ